uniref:Uncharacterized protein n=1 Tax=Nelumbo nucifera TaxID=4432 RepID=A0A822YQR1_NELNU|nr:TPA_asm: hypothetical protein HUJ06_010399 [Nelumbo nucifera]
MVRRIKEMVAAVSRTQCTRELDHINPHHHPAFRMEKLTALAVASIYLGVVSSVPPLHLPIASGYIYIYM